jgi:Tfp pilus assembly protein PilF
MPHLLEVDPKSSDAWAYLTTVLKEQGELVASEIALEHGLKQNPDHPLALTTPAS